MLTAEIFDPIPSTLFERLAPFASGIPSRRWDDVYLAMEYLRANYPSAVFRREPYYYLDLKAKKSGLLFIEDESERLYFVFQADSARILE